MISAVPTGLAIYFSRRPGTEVPGYFHDVPNGTNGLASRKACGIRRDAWRPRWRMKRNLSPNGALGHNPFGVFSKQLFTSLRRTRAHENVIMSLLAMDEGRWSVMLRAREAV